MMKDSDGNEVTLETLCRREPAWAASRIRLLEGLQRDTVECLDSSEDEAEDWKDRSARTEAELDALRSRFTAPIVCICGSTRFKQSWITENARLTGEGNIVLAVGLWGHHERQYPNEKTKAMLDDLHKRKIDLCDWVWVIDVGGYIGDSTRSEIEHAEQLGRPVRYLSQEFPDYEEPVDPTLIELARIRPVYEAVRPLVMLWKNRASHGGCDLRSPDVRALCEVFEKAREAEEVEP